MRLDPVFADLYNQPTKITNFVSETQRKSLQLSVELIVQHSDGRFKSVLVESSAREPDAPEGLTTMAAHIELNPVCWGHAKTRRITATAVRRKGWAVRMMRGVPERGAG